MPHGQKGRASFPPRVRRAILRRDRTCRACGLQPATEADHIIPMAEGGTHERANGQGLCAGCHEIKTGQERARGLQRYRQRHGPPVTQRRKPEPHPGIRSSEGG